VSAVQYLEYELLLNREFLDVLEDVVDSAKKRVYIATYIASLSNATKRIYYASWLTSRGRASTLS